MIEVVSREQKFSDELYGRRQEIERSSKQYMRDMVDRSKVMRVLDVGCGTGLNAHMLRNMGHAVVGIDLSPVAIEKLRAAGFEGHVCDVIDGLPFQAASFDYIYASEVIEHVSDTERFLSELGRVLRPGGTLLLSTPNSAFWPFRLLGLLGQTLTEMQHPGHLRFFSKKSLERSIRDAGFDDVQMSARHIYLVLPDALGRALSWLLKPLGFEREFRLRTNTYFWQLNRLAGRASSFWADTLIVAARKSN
ncbi:MAG: class I SAM-dependent methyltransferase [Parvibaculum sp.]|nr:class I SAM-dependent methyltransferase [Parvibaculum sp.]